MSASPISSRVPKIERRRGHTLAVPLSYAQEGLWFLEQVEPGNTAYNLGSAMRVRGKLDVGALERAFGELIRRHEILRTTFRTVEGVGQQVIGEAGGFGLEVEEVRGEEEARRRVEEELGRGFDLERGPLLRVRVLRVGEEEQVVVVNMHHIISDGWSMGVLQREMGILYEAYGKGEGSPLAELELQYGDYAVWQREWLAGEVEERQLGYWRRQLRGAEGVLRLPLDRGRGEEQSWRGGTVEFEVEKEVVEGLRRVGQEEGATLFMTLLAGYQTLLHYYSGQNDIVVGTDDANRQRGETEGLIGFFINQLALRSDFSGRPSFRQLLRQVRQTTLDAFVNRDVPFEKVVEALQVERTLQYTPLFQAKIVFQNTPLLSYAGDLEVSLFQVPSTVAKYDLTFTLFEAAEGLQALISYNTDLFEESTIVRISRQYRALLEVALQDADAPLAVLSTRVQERARVVDSSVKPDAPRDSRQKPLRKPVEVY